jgi:hypothetical protein
MVPAIEQMSKSQFRLRIAMGVLVTLVALLGLADFLPHTDDGCAVESHCLTCRAHMSAVTDLVTLSSLPTGANEFTAIEKADDQRPLDESSRLLPPGRAPPVSA